MSRARGFTLIELLVAMAIVAVIGVMALGGLSTVIQPQTSAEERAGRWRRIGRGGRRAFRRRQIAA